MRTINLNGYIDEEVWYGDEITPAMLHDALYGENSEFSDDVRIILNSYGGSCNAAVRMHDDIRAYPGRVHLVISGTAASAETVLSAAADTLEMTPGSLYMIHDPSTVAWGNERDFGEAIALLKACKESILNIYSRRSPIKIYGWASPISASQNGKKRFITIRMKRPTAKRDGRYISTGRRKNGRTRGWMSFP